MSHNIEGIQEGRFLSDLMIYHPLAFKIWAIIIPIVLLYLIYKCYKLVKYTNSRQNSSYMEGEKA